MIANLIAGQWHRPSTPVLPVYNPATEDVLDEVPLSGSAEVAQAVAAAAAAYSEWSRTPVMERTRLMFRYKSLLEEHYEELAAIVTRHHGKTLDEVRLASPPVYEGLAAISGRLYVVTEDGHLACLGQ